MCTCDQCKYLKDITPSIKKGWCEGWQNWQNIKAKACAAFEAANFGTSYAERPKPEILQRKKPYRPRR